MKKVIAIIVAGGKGKRIGADISKQYLNISGKPILAHTLKAFEDCNAIDSIIVVCHPSDMEYCKKNIIKKFGFKKVIKIVKGGKERQDSVRNGLDAVPKSCDIVSIHDGVRPFVSQSIIKKSISDTKKAGASVVCVPVNDTIKEVLNGYAAKTLQRQKLWAVQTPQTFKTEIIKKAHKKALEKGIITTDDSSLVEILGYKVKVVEGSYENIKITTPEDLIIGEAIANRLWI
ncbi:MAG: 2-C-methyl-D-erythritol 4-phosphate cytidylyltransferase [Deltaproteobacteria bacterium]|nr:2-C-methyl-D-erythritol 4-phosphate cytidylyltransferase [Deltaproteobacteria bacterium]